MVLRCYFCSERDDALPGAVTGRSGSFTRSVRGKRIYGISIRAQEQCESRGGRPGLSQEMEECEGKVGVVVVVAERRRLPTTEVHYPLSTA